MQVYWTPFGALWAVCLLGWTGSPERGHLNWSLLSRLESVRKWGMRVRFRPLEKHHGVWGGVHDGGGLVRLWKGWLTPCAPGTSRQVCGSLVPWDLCWVLSWGLQAGRAGLIPWWGQVPCPVMLAHRCPWYPKGATVCEKDPPPHPS